MRGIIVASPWRGMSAEEHFILGRMPPHNRRACRPRREKNRTNAGSCHQLIGIGVLRPGRIKQAPRRHFDNGHLSLRMSPISLVMSGLSIRGLTSYALSARCDRHVCAVGISKSLACVIAQVMSCLTERHSLTRWINSSARLRSILSLTPCIAHYTK